MSVYINKDDRVFIFEHINCSPVAGNVDTPLAFSVSSKGMVAKEGMVEIFLKNAKTLVKLTDNLNRNLFTALSKNSMELYFHNELR